MKKSGRVKVALVGAGEWGLQHARIFAGRQDVDLCAVVGRSLERTRARADEFATNYYLDIQHMLESERPDLVSLCLPNLGHFEPTLQVIEAGYPLLVEKPLVFDPEEANTLLEEAAKRGLFFAINFNHRYARPVQLARKAIEQGLLGDLLGHEERELQRQTGLALERGELLENRRLGVAEDVGGGRDRAEVEHERERAEALNVGQAH